MRSSRGFTIIELTVIVAVVAVLATVVMGNIQEARAIARDKERIVVLQQVEVALRLYKEQYGRYPESGCYDATHTSSCWVGNTFVSTNPSCAATAVACDTYIEGLEDLLNPLPVEKIVGANLNRGYIYRVTTDGSQYKFMSYGSAETVNITSWDSHPYARYAEICNTKFSDGSGDVTDISTFAVWYDSNPSNTNGPDCW